MPKIWYCFFAAESNGMVNIQGVTSMDRQIAEIAARVRENCDKGLGENCSCGNMIAKGEIGLEEAMSFSHSLLANDNRHTVVIVDGRNLMDLLGLDMFFDFYKDYDRDHYGSLELFVSYNPFVGVEDAVVIDERGASLGQSSLKGTVFEEVFQRTAFGPMFSDSKRFVLPIHRPMPLPGKDEGAHITKVGRDAKSGGRAKHWGSRRNYKGGN